MTIGIYKLNFADTDKVYIGQSIDIEHRVITHLSRLRSQKGKDKLQLAFNQYKYIGYEIICECSIDDLGKYEIEAIDIYDSLNNGFNSIQGNSCPVLHGEDNGYAKYSNDQYITVLELLVQETPILSRREVAEATKVSLSVVGHIAALESHTWLKEIRPIEYSILEARKYNEPYINRKQYPKIMAPGGKIYEVTHVTNFAKEHGLLQPKLSEVLNGKRNHYKGWSMVEA